jgi:hypothetical protein
MAGLDNPWVSSREPTVKQTAFLITDKLEALYGGAAGGGKSEALLIASAQFVEVPGYAALLFRRTYSDLSLPGALMDRSRSWWTRTGATWNGTTHTWTFPSGATITFGYLENDADKYRYQSSEFQFIGFDELTQFSEDQYRYLFSRLRRLKGSEIPLRMRAGSNPGGVGHDWVKSRFITPWKTGAMPADRCFVPARLEDNPFLDVEEYLQSLSHLDPVTRDQLRAGDWDAVATGRLKREWLRYYGREHNYLIFGEKRHPIEHLRNVFLTVDLAFTVKKLADWSVVSAWAFTPCGLLVWLGCLRFKAELPDAVIKIGEAYKRWSAGKVIVEGGGPQKGAVSQIRVHSLGGHRRMNVIEFIPSKKQNSLSPWRPTQDKLDRAAHMLNAAQAGRVWLPSRQADPTFPLEDVESEILRFTGDDKLDAHDDIWDTLSMAGIEHAGKLPTLTAVNVGGAMVKGRL